MALSLQNLIGNVLEATGITPRRSAPFLAVGLLMGVALPLAAGRLTSGACPAAQGSVTMLAGVGNVIPVTRVVGPGTV